MAAEFNFEPFPVCDLIPKKETGAERFLQKNSLYDGRGVVIAIFDTGVDPGADGLKVTTHGDRKILDLIDTTGSGDVDTSHVVKVSEDGTIQGLTGRKLVVPKSWQNPSGNWHVGSKLLYEVFPNELVSRLNKNFTDKVWEPLHNKAIADSARELATFEANHKADKMTYEEKLMKAELQARVDLLNDVSKKHQVPGPCVDVIVFHDGDGWRGVLDTSEKGDLSSCSVLVPFAESGMYGNFGLDDCLNYSINIYENGSVLSIVTPGGSHGTHVSCIASGHFPDNPDKNGIAPGAQIIGFKIGDSRLKTMETASALVRAATLAAKMKVDIVNFSYGEVAHWCNDGAALKQFRELVDSHGVLFVSSAGNNGPALSTVGTPGGNTSSLIGIGAFVTPSMMAAEYSLANKTAATPFTWSSRGPTVDGGQGVSVTAPGGAIASVCTYSLKCSQLMNGTSMSSPNASGGIALVVSALQAEGLSYNPALIKLAVENTASPLAGWGALEAGCGILQVDKALDYIRENAKTMPPCLLDMHFNVTVGAKNRGIYLREPFQMHKFNHPVSVTPVFHKDAAAASKLSLNLQLALVSSEPWVIPPKHLSLQNSSRIFQVCVDPAGLPPGVNYAEVCGIDTSGLFKGPLFRVPVTVLVPSELKSGNKFETSAELKNGVFRRYFLQVPKSATWAELSIGGQKVGHPVKMCVHAVQLVPECAFRKTEHFEFITLQPDAEYTARLPVKGGRTLEVCVGQWWHEITPCVVDVNLLFHSIVPSTDCLTLMAGSSYAKVDVTCDLGPEELSPEFKLTHQTLSKRPAEATIVPLGERDVLLKGSQQLYALNLTYKFSLAGFKSAEVRPVLTFLNDVLYESPYASQLWMLYDCNKQLLLSGDAYKKQYSVRLEKGDYTLKAQIKHELRSQLERLKDTPLTVEVALSSALTLEVLGSLKDALSGGGAKTLNTLKVRPGELHSLCVMALPEDKLPKGLCGTELKGHFVLQKNFGDKKHKGPVSYPLRYVCCPKVTAKKALNHSTSSSGDADSSSPEAYKKAFRDFQLTWMKKNSEVVPPDSLAEDYGEDLKYLLAVVHHAETSEKSAEEIQSAVQALCSKIDVQELLAVAGAKVDLGPDASKEQTETEHKKGILVEALLVEAKSILKVTNTDAESDSLSEEQKDRMKDISVVLHKLLSSSDSKLKQFKMAECEALGHWASLTKLIMDDTTDGVQTKGNKQKIGELSQKLGWPHMAEYAEAWVLIQHPPHYLPF